MKGNPLMWVPLNAMAKSDITKNNKAIPEAENAKHLGQQLNRSLTWWVCLFNKAKQLDGKFKKTTGYLVEDCN